MEPVLIFYSLKKVLSDTNIFFYTQNVDHAFKSFLHIPYATKRPIGTATSVDGPFLFIYLVLLDVRLLQSVALALVLTLEGEGEQ